MKLVRPSHLAAPLLVWAALACSSQQQEPLTVSAAGEPGYAERYPAELIASRERAAEYEKVVRETIDALPGYPDELQDADPELVLEIGTAADAAGRSRDYAERFAESERIDRFFNEEKDKLGQQVAGSVRYAAKQKGASDEILQATGGAAVHGLDRAITKQLEERMRARNHAHRLLEEHAETLGKPNVETLEKQVDSISRASYLLRVGLVELKRDLEARVEEGERVRETLDRVVEESRARSADASRSERERALQEQRLQAAQSARARLDTELEDAKRAIPELDQRIEQLTKDYEQAFEAWKQRLVERKDARGASQGSPGAS